MKRLELQAQLSLISWFYIKFLQVKDHNSLRKKPKKYEIG
jgi:hypothetical protein